MIEAGRKQTLVIAIKECDVVVVQESEVVGRHEVLFHHLLVACVEVPLVLAVVLVSLLALVVDHLVGHPRHAVLRQRHSVVRALKHAIVGKHLLVVADGGLVGLAWSERHEAIEHGSGVGREALEEQEWLLHARHATVGVRLVSI